MNHSDPIRRLAGRGQTLAIGTQVILVEDRPLSEGCGIKKSGSVGSVIAAPNHHSEGYLIECLDGARVFATDAQLKLRRAEVDALLQMDVNPDELYQYTIYRCMIGSRAYGLSKEGSDEDIRGIFLPPSELEWSLYAVPEQVENQDGDNDVVYFELKKFLKLALKANPNILELLWTPLVLEAQPLALELREMRSEFLSLHIHRTYSGYVLGQFRRMRNALAADGKFKPKHAMHLVRLLYSGIHALETGQIMVDVSEHRSELLEIRNGDLSFDQISEKALNLVEQFDQAAKKSTLPDQPNIPAVNDFLIKARRSMLK